MGRLNAFTGVLKNHGITISMDVKWRCMDNIFIERLWKAVKYEKKFSEAFETVPELLSGLRLIFSSTTLKQHTNLWYEKRLQRFIVIEKLLGRQYD